MSRANQNVLNRGAVTVISQFVPPFCALKRGNAVNGRKRATWTYAHDPTKVLNKKSNATNKRRAGTQVRTSVAKKKQHGIALNRDTPQNNASYPVRYTRDYT